MSKPFRLLVTGSRTWTKREEIMFDLAGLSLLYPEMIVVHGACPRGADAIAASCARELYLAQEPHPADWRQFGKAAGVRRNAEMVALGADLCLAYIMDGSRGATHTADLAGKAGIPVRRHEDSQAETVQWC